MVSIKEEKYIETTKNITRNFNKDNFKHNVLYGICTTGIVRMEWANAMQSLIYPVNWSNSMAQIPIPLGGPFGYHVAEGRNIIVQACLDKDFEWLLFYDHDCEPQPDALIRLNEYMEDYTVPVVSGLYWTKSDPSYPLLFRGRGNGPYWKVGGKVQWQMGDKVWVDGVPMGCTLIHNSILKVCWDEAEEYEIPGHGKCKKVFETPRTAWRDPQNAGHFLKTGGTEDLPWCEKVMKDKIFKKAGWPDIQRKKYPFLVDTNIFCWHRDISTGIAYPLIKPKGGIKIEK